MGHLRLHRDVILCTSRRAALTMLPRKLVRAFIRVAVVLTLISGVVFVSDLWYDFLPSSLQSKLPLHPKDPIIVDIKIETCGLFSACPNTQFPWEKQPKDLYLDTSWTSHAFIYTKSINEDELPRGQDVVLALAHTGLDEIPVEIVEEIELSPLPASSHKEKALLLGWKHRGNGLWVKYGKHVPNHAVTAVKVLYGSSAWYGLPNWYLCGSHIKIGKAEPRLAYRVGRQSELPEDPTLRFNKQGKLKIVQLADLHMSTGWGKCDCPVPEPAEGEECYADMRTTHLVEDVLDEEAPDFVVFSGDQIYGDSSPDPETSLLKALGPVIQREIPFALVLGNHDDDSKAISREQIMELVEQLPLFLGRRGPLHVPGVGNYMVTVSPPSSGVSSGASYPALAMYFMDSHSKTMPVNKESIYDWIKPEQHEYLRIQADDVRARLEGYPKIPLAMAFFHIPLPEYREDLLDEGGDAGLVRIGDRREGVVAPTINSGTMEVLRSIGVSVVNVGHDHVNDYCQLQQAPEHDEDFHAKNMWLCYGGGSGEGGYGGYPDSNGINYERRVRVFEIDMNEPSVFTWHRVQNHDDRINKVKLVSGGEAIYVSATNDDTE